MAEDNEKDMSMYAPNVPIEQTRNINPNLLKVLIPPEAVFSIVVTGVNMGISATLTDVIETIEWEMTMVYGQYRGTVAGSVKLPPPTEGSSFTPFDQLTKDQVVAWIGQYENMEEMKERMVVNMNQSMRKFIAKPVFKI